MGPEALEVVQRRMSVAVAPQALTLARASGDMKAEVLKTWEHRRVP